MKKIMILFLALVTVTSLGMFCACGKTGNNPSAPTTYTVTFEGEGVTTPAQKVEKGQTAIEPKFPERDGYTFDFWYLKGQQEVAYEFSTAVVSDITLVAHWTVKEMPISWTYLNWNAGNFAEFLVDGVSGQLIDRIVSGNEVLFLLKTSPYSTGEAVVKAGDEVLTPDKDGWYEFIATGETMLISVTGLKNDTTPITGVGTSNDPYVLSTPSNFKTFVDAVNNQNNTKYNTSYVVLGSDISFKGEELDPIGIALNTAHFAGIFDGQGHTVSDFVMKGKNGIAGLFGYAVTAQVSNVNVKNATYTIDTAEKYNYIVGGIVAYSMGSDISGCGFDGKISIGIGDNSLNSYVGGIAGFVQGYSTDYSATVSYSTAKVQFESTGSVPLFTVGGIAGCVYGTSITTPTNVYNCVSQVSFSGRLSIAGGIIGYMRAMTSVANCYSAGDVTSRNDYLTSSVSTAGALVGLAETETAITNSYSTATVAYLPGSAANIEGTERGILIGSIYKDGKDTENLYNKIDSKKTVVYNSYLANNSKITANGQDYDVNDLQSIKGLLKWSESEWNYDGNAPAVKVNLDGEYGISYTVTVNLGGKVTEDITESVQSKEFNEYLPLDWLYDGDGKNTLKATDGSISYGFFLDEGKTQRLPASMLLTSDVTIYVGFADYTAASGEYFFDVNDKRATLTFDSNGMLTFVYDGRVARYMYVYDGEKIYIQNAYFAYMYFTSSQGESIMTDYYAYKDGESLVIYDNFFFTGESDYKNIQAYKGNSIIGEWYDRDGTIYKFNLNGKGLKTSADLVEIPFEYSINGNVITMYVLSNTYSAKLSEDGRKIENVGGLTLSLDVLDKFEGDWETDFNNPLKVSFDGKGTMKIGDNMYAYTVNGDGLIKFAGGYARVNSDGYIDLTIEEEGTTYSLCRAYSYRGYWEETLYDYGVRFDGITIDGYGTGVDTNGYSFTYTAYYISDDTGTSGEYSINLYYRTTLYGFGSLMKTNKGEEALGFAVYTQSVGGIYDNYNLCYYDPLDGEWSIADGTVFKFNGLGAYDINMTTAEGTWTAKGEVTIGNLNTADEAQTVAYTYDKTYATAAFTYNGKNYAVKVQKTGVATIQVSGETEQGLYHSDGLEDMILGGEGYRFTFNGHSGSGNGVATVTTKDIKEQKFVYTYDGTTIEIRKEGNVWLNMVADEKHEYFTLDDGDKTVTLGLYALMSGKTYLFANGEEITVGSFDLKGYGTGSMAGEELSLLYSASNQIQIYYAGELLYIGVYQDEHNMALYDASYSLVTVVCENDGYKGEYVSASGDSITLDGRGLIVGYYPAATVKENGETTYLYYSIEEDGNITVFALDRSEDTDVKITKYKVYNESVNGAVEYERTDGKAIYVVKAA